MSDTLPRYLAADLAPGLLDGSPLRTIWRTPPRYGIPEHPRDGAEGVVLGAPVPRGETDALFAPTSGLAWAEEWLPISALWLDAQRPEVMHRGVDWARAGGRCPNRYWFGSPDEACAWRDPHGAMHVYPGKECPLCASTGYTRPPHDLAWALPIALGGKIARVDHSAAILVRSVEGIVGGQGPIAGLFAPWRYMPGHEWYRPPVARGEAARPIGHILANEESEPPAADRAALSRRFALLDGDSLVLPGLEMNDV